MRRPTAALAGDGTFPDALVTTITDVNDPAALAIGDFNNDGRQDLAVGEESPNSVAVLTGLGEGTFAPATHSAVGTEPRDLAVADFNGDGNEDIAAVGGDDNLLSILRGNGNGTFQATLDTVLSDQGLAVGVGDFDGNGIADLAISQDDDSVTARFGNGNATFVAGPDLATGPQPESLAVGDFDGDGDEDVATGDTNGQAANGAGASIRLNNGTGAFDARIVVAVDNGGDSIVAADFDSDGDDDLATRRQNGIAVIKSNGNGTFTRVEFDAGGSSRGIAVGDVNSDDRLDLLVIQTASQIAVLPGNGEGGFGAPAVQAASTLNSGDPVVGDFNADGTEDFAYPESNIDDRVFVRRGAGAPADSTNLLVNGGGEAATGSAAARTTAQTPAIPGWASNGPLTNVRYDAAGGFPLRLNSARWGGQEAFFAGGSAAASSAGQTIDISGSAASVDAGLATVRLSGYPRRLSHEQRRDDGHRDIFRRRGPAARLTGPDRPRHSRGSAQPDHAPEARC